MTMEVFMDDIIDKLIKNIRTIGEIRNDSELYIVITDKVNVCNEKGSSIRSPKCVNCGSWKNHWQKFAKNKWPVLCCNSNCQNSATVGGHVVFADNKNGRKYIVPLCDECNKKSSDEVFMIDEGTVMVSDNCSDTCDKLL